MLRLHDNIPPPDQLRDPHRRGCHLRPAPQRPAAHDRHHHPAEGPPVVAVPARCWSRGAGRRPRQAALGRRQLGDRAALPQLAPRRAFVAGETFPYLGRQYPLVLRDDDGEGEASGGALRSGGVAPAASRPEPLARSRAGPVRRMLRSAAPSRAPGTRGPRGLVRRRAKSVTRTVSPLRAAGRRGADSRHGAADAQPLGSCTSRGRVGFAWSLVTLARKESSTTS